MLEVLSGLVARGNVAAAIHLSLAERLMTAMKAGGGVGGDKRGTLSAALVINKGEAYPWGQWRNGVSAQVAKERDWIMNASPAGLARH